MSHTIYHLLSTPLEHFDAEMAKSMWLFVTQKLGIDVSNDEEKTAIDPREIVFHKVVRTLNVVVANPLYAYATCKEIIEWMEEVQPYYSVGLHDHVIHYFRRLGLDVSAFHLYGKELEACMISFACHNEMPIQPTEKFRLENLRAISPVRLWGEISVYELMVCTCDVNRLHSSLVAQGGIRSKVIEVDLLRRYISMGSVTFPSISHASIFSYIVRELDTFDTERETIHARQIVLDIAMCLLVVNADYPLSVKHLFDCASRSQWVRAALFVCVSHFLKTTNAECTVSWTLSDAKAVVSRSPCTYEHIDQRLSERISHLLMNERLSYPKSSLQQLKTKSPWLRRMIQGVRTLASQFIPYDLSHAH